MKILHIFTLIAILVGQSANFTASPTALQFNWQTQFYRGQQLAWDIDKLEQTAEIVADNLYNAIDHNGYIKPEEFILGTGSSAHQVEGHCDAEHCSFVWWEQELLNNDIKNTNDKGEQIVHDFTGNANNFFELYNNPLQCHQLARSIKKSGLTAYRLSFEMSKCEQYGYDEMIKRYRTICGILKQHNLTVIAGLEHYTYPTRWVKDKLPEETLFRNAQHIVEFVQYCQTMYKGLHDVVDQWITFNSPDGYAAKIYLANICPPDIRKFKNNKYNNTKDFKGYAEELCGRLTAHAYVYHSLKTIARENNWQEPQIGIVKNMHQLDPAHNGIKGFLEKNIICKIGNDVQNKAFYNSFNTGKFKFNVGPKVYLNKKVTGLQDSLDFICINYYSNRFISFTGNVQEQNPVYQTQNKDYRIYPEGLFRALIDIHNNVAHPVGINKNGTPLPIIVSENGLATDDAEKRARAILQYKYAMVRAVELKVGQQNLKSPINLIGSIEWSHVDSYEWGQNNLAQNNIVKEYGIFNNNFEPKDGTEPFFTMVNRFYTI
jgi:beta-glucosidase